MSKKEEFLRCHAERETMYAVVRQKRADLVEAEDALKAVSQNMVDAWNAWRNTCPPPKDNRAVMEAIRASDSGNGSKK
jgi:hypothetical protein